MSAVLSRWLGDVSRAACAFEARWTFGALRRVDATLAQRLDEQRSLWDAACITGSDDDVALHGAAMCRGWAAGVRACEAAGLADDAYQLGRDAASGLVVAIGDQRAAADRVREIHGERVVWVTPDECARMLASIESFKFVGAVKQFFPGAELIDRYPDQPAKAG